jgi:two-component system chemotaxis sensor kinase CheA
MRGAIVRTMNYTFSPEDLDILRALLEEWAECQEGLEKQILQLEVHDDDLELINDIFRRIHSIKGGSSFVGLTFITKLTHEIETALDAIRKRQIVVDSELIDSLLSGVDFLNNAISGLSQKIKDHDSSNEDKELILEMEVDDEKKLEQIAYQLSAVYEKKRKLLKEFAGKEITDPVGHENVAMDILQSEQLKKTLSASVKEQFLFETYEHIERMENEFLLKLENEEDNPEAVNELFRAVHSIKGGVGLFIATESKESSNMAVLHEFTTLVHTFESLLTVIRDKKIKFGKEILNLSYEVVDYLKAAMESITLEKGSFISNAEILDKIETYVSYLESLDEKRTDGDLPLSVKKKSNDPEPMQKSVVSQSIRVSRDKLDKMMNMISELLITKNTFMHLAAKLNVEYDFSEISKEVKQVSFAISRISDELQNAIMSMRMIEVKTLFQKMPRIIRDISQNTGKKMELILRGETTEIDKTIVEQISDPLVHLIRNAADHGIESPEVRLAKGKSETGKIILRAYNKDKNVYIEIEDDGKGINAQILKKKALDKGFITEENAEKMTKSQLINLIFLPGFSTADQVTEVSGRGVGMDVVKSNIEKIGGDIAIESEVDKGTKMVIHLPLTLAISRGLTVNVSKETYIIPIDNVSETVKINTKDIHEYSGKYFSYLRGEIIGIEWLSSLLLLGERDRSYEELNAVIISNGREKLGLIVDKLLNEQEYVIKPLSGHLAGIPGISGSTLLGNGQVVLILNPIDLIQLAKSEHSDRSELRWATKN